LTDFEASLCNLFIYSRLRSIFENYPPLHDWFPSFGDSIKEGDEDQLGKNSLENYTVANGRTQIPSEHIIIEQAINLLKDDGLLGFILPDGVFNNQGEQSNCPQLRSFLVKNGIIQAVVSLPDYAFRKSGAQNKTSILFYKKFNYNERVAFKGAYDNIVNNNGSEDAAIVAGLTSLNYNVFMAEANSIGYSSTGVLIEKNDLYRGEMAGHLDSVQTGTILGEYLRFKNNTSTYIPEMNDCASINITSIWNAHDSHRLDPKYHLFKVQESHTFPEGWERQKLSELMERREEIVHPEDNPDLFVKVMTLSQTGDPDSSEQCNSTIGCKVKHFFEILQRCQVSE